jgi:hypothetical protein
MRIHAQPIRLSSLLLGLLALNGLPASVSAQSVNVPARSSASASDADPKQQVQDQPPAVRPNVDESAQTKPATSGAAGPATKAEKGDQAAQKWHVHLGRVELGASYTRFSDGFLVSPYWGGGFNPYYSGYTPFFYDPFYDWSFYGPDITRFEYSPDKGEVRLEAKPSSASVYLDDAYAGTAVKLKHFWLSPGAYDLTVDAVDGSEFHQRIYVLNGKSIKVRAKFVARNE